MPMENFDNRASSLESEDRYRQLVELCPDLIAINHDGKIAFINSAGAKLLGAESPDQLIGRSVKDFIHTQNYELSRQRLQQLKQSKRVPSIEETFIRLDGTVFYAEASAMPITYCGKPAILVVAHDVTERKLAEEALQENERRFLSLTQSIPDGIMLVDHNNTIIYWNHGSQNIFGYSEEEVLGKPSGMLLPEQDRETHRKGFEKLLQTGESSVLGKIFESRGLRKDGSIFPTEISISHWNTADGVCYCAVIRDISEHKLAEQQLRETKEYLDNLIDSSLDGIVAVNNDGHIIRANSYFMELIGYRREEVLGQRIARFFPLEPNTYHSSAGETVTIDEDHIKDFRDIVGRLFTEGKVDSWLTHIICKNSLAIPVSLNIVALHDRQQQVIGALGIIRNITEQKKAENKLRQSHETLRALINAAPESLFLLDIDGTVITANETLARRMGTTVNELVGANIYSYLPDDLIASRRMFAEQALKDKEMVYYEDVRGDRYMANYVYPFPGRNGDSTRVAVFSWDITDHKHAEEELRRHRDHLDELVRIKTAELTCANEQLQQKIDLHLQAEKSLRESEQNFRSLVQLSPDGIGISHHGTVVFINSAGARIFGAESFDQILGKQVVELVHPDYRELVENRMRKITSGGICVTIH